MFEDRMNKFFLATSADERTWDCKDKKVIFAEAGCAINNMEKYINNEKYIFPVNRWNDCANYETEVHFLDEIQADIFNRLVEGYRKFTGLDLREIDVDRLLYPWLDYYIDTMYYKFFCIEDIEKKYKDISLCELRKEDFYYCNIPMDFMAKVATDDWFNLQLCTVVAKYKGLPFTKCVSKEGIEFQDNKKKKYLKKIMRIPKRIVHYCFMQLEKKKKQIWCKFINHISYKAESIVINPTRFLMTNKELLKMIIASKGKIGAYYYDFVQLRKNKYNEQLRKSFFLDKKNSLCDFEKFLLERIIYDLPINCIEDVMNNFNDKNSAKYQNVKKIISVSDAKCDFRAKAFIISKGKSCKWYDIEVGGGGDLWSGRTEVEGEIRISDIYYTNGWSDNRYKEKMRPYHNPRFLKARSNIDSKERKGVLYVGTFIPKYRCIHGNTVCRNPESYIENCLAFLNCLKEKNIDVTVRLHHDCGWKVKEQVIQKFPSIKIEELEKPFEETVKMYKLYICDLLSTTWGEAYASGTPIIFIGDKTRECYSAVGEYWINSLRHCGVYQDNYMSAVEYIETIVDTIEEWWMDSERQEIVREFVNLYANLPFKQDENVWINEIMRIANE